MTTEYFVLTRAVHFGACLLFFGVFVFDRLCAPVMVSHGQSEIYGYWRARMKVFSAISLPVIFLSGLAWFLLVAMSMSGEPLQWAILRTVWTQTQFGIVWKRRLLFGCLAAVTAGFIYFQPAKSALQKIWMGSGLLWGGLLLGSLAWAGHGREASPWHLLADILHLLVAGFWPAGLLPLYLLVRRLRRRPDADSVPALAALVRRFSALSLAAVALLAATGLVNTWYLVGSLENLFQQTYGRWLCVKIMLYIIAVGVGAVNLLRLKPRLAGETSRTSGFEDSAAQLQFNVRMEILLGSAIILVVAVLGILPPANR